MGMLLCMDEVPHSNHLSKNHLLELSSWVWKLIGFFSLVCLCLSQVSVKWSDIIFHFAGHFKDQLSFVKWSSVVNSVIESSRQMNRFNRFTTGCNSLQQILTSWSLITFHLLHILNGMGLLVGRGKAIIWKLHNVYPQARWIHGWTEYPNNDGIWTYEFECTALKSLSVNVLLTL